MDASLAKKIQNLEIWFATRSGTITAFSGGVDSALVLFLSHHFLGKNAFGCISISPSLKRKDFQIATSFCHRFGIHLEIIETQEISDPNYFANPSNRCYFCKSHLYQDLQKLSEKYPHHVMLNGTNADDLGDYRPGLIAANENEILSPLVDCGITKSEVRALAKYFDLPVWNKPASPCLSSRVPYGNEITRHKLWQIEAAEGILNGYGFEDVRVRHFGDEARIEVAKASIPSLQKHFIAISASIKALGFGNCTVDQEGFISGKLNRSIL